MKKQYWVLLFVLILSGDIVGIYFKNNLVQSIFKPMIIPVLIGYFDSQVKSITKGMTNWVLLALIFSFGGDVLLMFQEKKSVFFLFGLTSFLVAHIFYIIFFQKIRIRELVKGNPWFLLIVVVYYAGLMYMLFPFLGEMKLPVIIYGIVISFMLMFALHMTFIKNHLAGIWMLAGAVLFVISDSVLAINKFYQNFEAAGIVIMITYGLAQLFITQGAIKYLRKQ